MPATVLQKDKDILRSQGAFNLLKLSGKLYIPSTLQFSSSSFFPRPIFMFLVVLRINSVYFKVGYPVVFQVNNYVIIVDTTKYVSV
jgi:hypothetical protein